MQLHTQILALRVALRYLRSKKSHNAVNVIAWISVAGVAVATAAIVVVLSVFNGFTDLAAEHLSIMDPELKIMAAKGKTINNADSVVEVLLNSGLVEYAQPVIEERALAGYGERQTPVRVKGVCQDYDETSTIGKEAIIDGGFWPEGYASISVGVANALMARPHPTKKMYFYAPKRKGRINPSNPMGAFRMDSVVVSSVFQINQPEYDTDFVILPIDIVRNILNYTTEATAIEIQLSPQGSRNKVSWLLGDGYAIQTQMEQQKEAFKMIAVEKWVTFMMLGFILVIASFNIISTLSMLVVEKKSNMATLRAMGATRMTITQIFVDLGWVISIVGGFIGIIIGLALSLGQQYGGFIRLSGDPSNLTIETYPVRVAFGDLFVVAALVGIIGLVTSFVTVLIANPKVKK